MAAIFYTVLLCGAVLVSGQDPAATSGSSDKKVDTRFGILPPPRHNPYGTYNPFAGQQGRYPGQQNNQFGGGQFGIPGLQQQGAFQGQVIPGRYQGVFPQSSIAQGGFHGGIHQGRYPPTTGIISGHGSVLGVSALGICPIRAACASLDTIHVNITSFVGGVPKPVLIAGQPFDPIFAGKLPTCTNPNSYTAITYNLQCPYHQTNMYYRQCVTAGPPESCLASGVFGRKPTAYFQYDSCSRFGGKATFDKDANGKYYCTKSTAAFTQGAIGSQLYCPSIRLACPPHERFIYGVQPPQPCYNDLHCPADDKCCYDTCLGEVVCKPPRFI